MCKWGLSKFAENAHVFEYWGGLEKMGDEERENMKGF